MAVLSALRVGTRLVHTNTGKVVVLARPEPDKRIGGWWTDDDDPAHKWLSVSSLMTGWQTMPQLSDFAPLHMPRDQITERFYEFHNKHPEVLTEIIRLAEQAANAGQTKTSMKRIFEVMRWSRHIQGDAEDQFKLNNVFTSRYARLIGEVRPDLADMFNTRKLAAERVA